MGRQLQGVEINRLSAKTRPPSLDERAHLRRPRLDARLRHQLVRHRVLVLQARAGQGKTRAAAELAADARWPTVWYRLDETDNDPARLSWGLAAALRRGLGARCAGPLLPVPVDSRRSAQAPEATLEALFADPGWPCHETVLFVLEDLHRLTDGDLAARLIAALLAAAPPNVRLLMTTRRVLDAHPAADAVPADRVVVTDEALAFSRDEVRAYLLHVLGMAVSRAQEEWLYRRLRGWPLGLALSRSLLQRRPLSPQALAAIPPHPA